MRACERGAPCAPRSLPPRATPPPFPPAALTPPTPRHTRSQAPNYFNIIKQPMDFSTIKRKQTEGAYTSWPSLRADLKCGGGSRREGGGGGEGAARAPASHATPCTHADPWPPRTPPHPHTPPHTPHRLMFSNAMRYNVEGSDVWRYAKSVNQACSRILDMAE